MTKYDAFFILVDIDENEKGPAKEYIDLRGLQEHIDMATYLSSFISNRKPSYKEVATTFRYDKRIRRILYKYIGLLEEYLRAYICNNFSRPSQLGLKTYKKLYDYIYSSLFSSLIKIIWSLDSVHKDSIFKTNNVLKKNLVALVGLRNAISHNRTIINYNNFESVTLSTGETGNSLLLNIKNMLELLPKSIKQSCINEINNSSRNGTKKLNNQVEWELIKTLILKI